MVVLCSVVGVGAERAAVAAHTGEITETPSPGYSRVSPSTGRGGKAELLAVYSGSRLPFLAYFFCHFPACSSILEVGRLCIAVIVSLIRIALGRGACRVDVCTVCFHARNTPVLSGTHNKAHRKCAFYS